MRPTISLDQPLKIGPLGVPNRLFLAPMSGVTDRPFRARAVTSGIGLAFAEMVASGELNRGRSESIRRVRPGGGTINAVQLVGRDPSVMGEAAAILADSGVDLIDINMGCPAKKVTTGACGAALMTEPDVAAEIVDAVVRAAAGASVVSVKMRLGWSVGSLTAPSLARRLADRGAAMISVHGRTREQKYSGSSDPDAIAAVRAAVPDVVFVANGDVHDRRSAMSLLARTGADAVMIGRAHYGQPYLAATMLGNGRAPAAADRAGYIAAHYEEMLVEYGRERGARHARKHLGWYLDRYVPTLPREARNAVMTAHEPVATLRLLSDLLATADGDRSGKQAA